MASGSLAQRLAGIPVVRNASERDAVFPSPDLRQRVHNLFTGTIQMWNGSAWVDVFFSGALSTGTPQTWVNDVVVVAQPQVNNFTGRVVGTDDGTQANVDIPDLPISDAGGVIVASPRNLRFQGSGVAVTDAGAGLANVQITAGGGASISANDGTPIGPFSQIDFDYTGVSVSDEGGGKGRVLMPAYIPPSLGFPDTPPETPHAYDDEFRSASLDAKWNVTDTPNVTYSTVVPSDLSDWFIMESVGFTGLPAADYVYMMNQDITGFSGAFMMVARVRATRLGNSGANQTMFIELNVGGTFGVGVRYGVEILNDSSTTRVRGYKDGFTWTGGNTNQANNPGEAVYIAIVRSAANNQSILYSGDGFSWSLIADREGSVTYSPTKLFVRMVGPNITTNNGLLGIDFIRFNDSRFRFSV